MVSLTKRQLLEYLESELDQEYAEYEPEHRDLQRYIMPERGVFDRGDDHRRSQARSKRSAIINSHATTSAEILAAGMMSGLTRPTHPWFKLTDPGVEHDPEAKEWLEHATTAVRDLFTRSNLYQSLPSFYKDAGVFGTAVMTVQPKAPASVHTYVHPIGTYRLAHDEYGELSVFHNVRSMTLLQIAERWGEDALPIRWRDQLRERNSLNQRLDVKQTIRPNPDYRPRSARPLERKFVQTFWLDDYEGVPDDGILEERGHDVFPIVPFRWERNGTSPYGYGPGTIALPDIKMLQRLRGKSLTNLDKGVDPTMIAPPHLRQMGGVEHRPGAVTWLDASAQGARLEPQYVPDPRYMEYARLQSEETKQDIDRAFHTDLFRILADITDDRQITAYHVSQIVGERNTQLGPVLERGSADSLDKLVELGYGIARSFGLIRNPPPSLVGIELRVEYLSIIAQAQKLDSARGIQATTEYAMAAAGLDERVPLAFDAVEALRQIGEIHGVPEGVIRSLEEIQERQRQIAEAQARQQAIESAPQLAQAAQSASNIDSENLASVARAIGSAPAR